MLLQRLLFNSVLASSFCCVFGFVFLRLECFVFCLFSKKHNRRVAYLDLVLLFMVLLFVLFVVFHSKTQLNIRPDMAKIPHTKNAQKHPKTCFVVSATVPKKVFPQYFWGGF